MWEGARRALSPFHFFIAPTLCVGALVRTLCVHRATQSVAGCIPTQSVGTIAACLVLRPFPLAPRPCILDRP